MTRNKAVGRQEAKTRPGAAAAAPSARKNGSHPALASVVSALLLVMAYEPIGAWWVAWFALVPLLLVARAVRRSTGSILSGAWVGGLVFWLISVEWVRKSDPGAWPGWLALALTLSFWWPAFVGLTRIAVRGLGVPLMLAAPAVWVALEFVRAYHPLNGFHWFYLSQSQYRLGWLIQVSDLTGAWGLSFLVVLVNAWIVNLLTLPLLRPTPKGPRLTRPQAVRLALVGSALGGVLCYGAIRTSTADFRPGPRLALLQSDFPQDFRNPPSRELIAARFRRLVEKSLAGASGKKPDLIVWPETFFPSPWVRVEPDLPPREFQEQVARFDPQGTPGDWMDQARRSSELLRGWVDGAGVPMLIGVNSHIFQRGGKGFYNTALLAEPGSDAFQSYHKIHLVPFGEYIPLLDLFPWVLSLTPFSPEHLPNLTPGRSPTSFRLGDWRLTTVICFEDSVPQVARAALLAGDRQPDVLINISNDGWFRGTAAHELHMANSVFRAVELRVPVARAVNTGISGLIDGNGRIVEQLGPAREDVLLVTVPLDDRRSFYALVGPLLAWLCLAGTLLSPPLALLRRRGLEGAKVTSGTAVATDRPTGSPAAGELPGRNS